MTPRGTDNNEASTISRFEGSYTGYASMQVWDKNSSDGNIDGKNRRTLEVRAKSLKSEVDDALVLREAINDVWHEYKIYHSGMSTPIPIEKGGTGATSAVNARSNLDVPKTDGTGSTGTWPINITGYAADLGSGAVLAVEKGGTNATTAAAARANLGITPANIGAVAISSAETCLFKAQEIPANGTRDISFATSYRSFFMLAMGSNDYTHDYYEGFKSDREICIPVVLASSTNQYALLSPPNDSWRAWFLSETVLHVVNRTSNIMKFRLNGFK